MKTIYRKVMLHVMVLIPIVGLLSACTVKEVKPWEKEVLAKETMQLGGPNKLLNKFEEHIYFSKEGSKGGNGVIGGGCGCN